MASVFHEEQGWNKLLVIGQNQRSEGKVRGLKYLFWLTVGH